MTNQQHLITPPPKLVQQWFDAWAEGDLDDESFADYVVVRAAQWGADQELDACCEWLEQQTLCGHRDLLPSLRAARRSKPPSLKEQALTHFESFAATFETSGGDSDLIRRALEQLDD